METEVATGTKRCGQGITSLPWTNATISPTPRRSGQAPLRRAPIKGPHSTTRNLQVKVIGPQIASTIGHLHNHGLSEEGRWGKVEFVAGTTPAGLVGALQLGSSEPVSQFIANRPWLIVVAGVRRTPVAATLCVDVDDFVRAVFLASLDWLGDRGFSVPRAARFAAIPVACGFSACRVHCLKRYNFLHDYLINSFEEWIHFSQRFFPFDEINFVQFAFFFRWRTLNARRIKFLNVYGRYVSGVFVGRIVDLMKI